MGSVRVTCVNCNFSYSLLLHESPAPISPPKERERESSLFAIRGAYDDGRSVREEKVKVPPPLSDVTERTSKELIFVSLSDLRTKCAFLR